jgi:predicted transcriptional regulator with HTH domain
MFIEDQQTAQRVRTRRTLFSLWMAIAALTVIVTMAAGLATSAHASEISMVIKSVPSSAVGLSEGLNDRVVLMACLVASFLLMMSGTAALARRSLKDVAKDHVNGRT